MCSGTRIKLLGTFFIAFALLLRRTHGVSYGGNANIVNFASSGSTGYGIGKQPIIRSYGANNFNYVPQQKGGWGGGGGWGNALSGLFGGGQSSLGYGVKPTMNTGMTYKKPVYPQQPVYSPPVQNGYVKKNSWVDMTMMNLSKLVYIIILHVFRVTSLDHIETKRHPFTIYRQ